MIRPAAREDAQRIAEIMVFNYRLNFYPIFQDDGFYFEELTVSAQAERFAAETDSLWVYDDGAVKGFVQVEHQEVKKLFVEPVLQGRGIGAALLDYAAAQKDARTLWALEKNVRAIAFYARHGFEPTGDRKYEEDTTEFLVRLQKRPPV